MKNKPMVTCDGEIGRPHAPITFEGYFVKLCPLCAAIAEKEEAAEKAEEAIKDHEEMANAATAEAEGGRETAERRQDLCETALEGAAAQLKDMADGADTANNTRCAIVDFLADLRAGKLD